MKKIISTLILVGLLTVLVTPLAVSAIGGPEECCKIRRSITVDGNSYAKGDYVGPTTTTDCSANKDKPVIGKVTKGTSQWGVVCLVNAISGFTDIIFMILMALSVFFVVVGGMMFITSSGDTEKIGKAKDMIQWALVGLVVALLARAIPAIVMAFIG